MTRAKQRQRRTRQHALVLFSQGKTINLRGARRLCLLLFQADSERALFWRDRKLAFARQPPNCPVEGGFLPFYRFLQFAEGQFALRVGHVPDRSGSLADFFFIVIPFPLHNPHRANTHRIFDKMKRVKPAPVSQI